MRRQVTVLGMAAALALAVTLTATGCSGAGQDEEAANGGQDGGAGTSKVETSTVFEALPEVMSTVETAAPDARLVAVEMLQSATVTSTPAWAYLVVSPSTGKGYLVYTIGGRIMTSEEYGKLELSEEAWAKIPEKMQVNVDNDEALQKALEASGAEGLPAAYYMGLLTYKSPEDTSSVEPGKWSVWFEPGDSGATSAMISVDAKTGEVKVADSE